MKTSMKEGLVLPPVWCSQICRAAMTEKCVSHCAIKRDTSSFEMKKGMPLVEMPKFPDTANMTREEKFTVVAIYLSKIVDHLQGVDSEPIMTPPLRRQNLNRISSENPLAGVRVVDLLATTISEFTLEKTSSEGKK